jgi:hypothetical protein
MSPAVAGNVALAAEYNKLITNITDLDTRMQVLENGTSSSLGARARTTSSTGISAISTTETIIQSATFTAEVGRRYRAILDAQFVFSDTSYYIIRGRWVTGATVTSAGTQFYYRFISAGTPGNWEGPKTVIAEVTGIPAGQATIGFSIVRSSGSGNVDARADASDLRRMYIDDIGV